MAGAFGGEVRALDAVVLASCRTITSCSRVADVKRAPSGSEPRRGSTRSTDRRISTRPAASTTPECSSPDNGRSPRRSYGGASVGHLIEPELYAEALALFGELWVTQGRVWGEAEQLIAGYEQHAAVVRVLAVIRAAQGQFEVAEWLARRRLDLLVASPLAAAEMRGLLVELELARGKFQEALAEAEALSATTSHLGIPAVWPGATSYWAVR